MVKYGTSFAKMYVPSLSKWPSSSSSLILNGVIAIP